LFALESGEMSTAAAGPHDASHRREGSIRMARKWRRLVGVAALAGCSALLACAPTAGAVTATAAVTAGTLGFVSAPPNVTFSGTLSGLNQTLTAAQAINVGDATGSGAGWNLTATSTTFANGAHLLSTTATTITAAPTVACDAGVTCTRATKTALVTYPYTLPAAATPPTATRFFNSRANRGMGDQTVTPTWRLAVPANAYAGAYTSTWTVSLVSGP
jgi:hypothetical protein